jgi:hypothetical protein
VADGRKGEGVKVKAGEGVMFAGEMVGVGPDLVQLAKRTIVQAERTRKALFLIERIIRISHNLSMRISLRSGNL